MVVCLFAVTSITEALERSAYIEQRNGRFYVAGACFSFDAIVYSFKAGNSPETKVSFSSCSIGMKE